MATFYANGYGAALGAGASAGSAPDLSSPALLNGKLRIANFKYTAAGTKVASTSDIIKVCRLPKGARVWLCYFGCEDMASAAGTRLTMKLGSASGTAISAAKDPNSAIATAVDLTAITGVTNANGVAVTAGNEEVVVAVSGTSGALTGNSFWGSIFYSVE